MLSKIKSFFSTTGGIAPRCFFVSRNSASITDDSIRRTACESCDYLLIQCLETGKVIEAYAPGIDSYCAIDSVAI